jgi:uncharacterized protein with HEPN domain
MQRDLCSYLWDIATAAEFIATFTAGLTFEDYRYRDLEQAAVERKFEIIGEALKQAARHFPGSVDSIPDLSEVVGQRDRIAHGYFAVDQKILWNTIESDLPVLRERIRRLREEKGCE